MVGVFIILVRRPPQTRGYPYRRLVRAMEGMAQEGGLVVRRKGEEPHRNVGRSVRALGHAIVSEVAHADGSMVLIIRKKAG